MKYITGCSVLGKVTYSMLLMELLDLLTRRPKLLPHLPDRPAILFDAEPPIYLAASTSHARGGQTDQTL